MNVLLKPFFGSIYKKNRIFKDNNGDNIFFGFKGRIKIKGINLNTIDIESKQDIDCYVFCDVPMFWELYNWKMLLLNRNKSVLICFESPVVNPFSHIKLFHRLFRVVYTWNDRLVDDLKVKKFNLPVLDTNLDHRNPFFKKKKLMCFVNSNKSIPYLFYLISPFKKILYSERIKVIEYFEKINSDQFDFFGRGWNAPKKFDLKEKIFGFKKYKNYRGDISRDSYSKIKVMSNYKFNLCFENCVADGYISEKIMDCFKAGTVPVYLGSPNIEKYIPINCFIDFRKFKNISQMALFLENMKDEEYKTYLVNGKKLLKNNNFRNKWFEEGFEKLFLNAVMSVSV